MSAIAFAPIPAGRVLQDLEAGPGSGVHASRVDLAQHLGGDGAPIPAGGAHVAVPLSGERGKWEVVGHPGAEAIPVEVLEAGAQGWYEFRDGSLRAKLWSNLPRINCALTVCAFIPAVLLRGFFGAGNHSSRTRSLQPNTILHDPPVESSVLEITPVDWEAVIVLGISIYVVLSLLAWASLLWYVQYRMIWRLKDEVSEHLAVPLSRALANSGWTVEAECSKVQPQGLDQGSTPAGWIWLNIKPAVQAIGARCPPLSARAAGKRPRSRSPFRPAGYPFAPAHALRRPCAAAAAPSGRGNLQSSY